MEKSFTQQCMRLRHVWLRPVRRAGVGRTGVGDAFGNALGSSVVGLATQGSQQEVQLQGAGPWSTMGYRNGMDVDSDNYRPGSDGYFPSLGVQTGQTMSDAYGPVDSLDPTTDASRLRLSRGSENPRLLELESRIRRLNTIGSETRALGNEFRAAGASQNAGFSDPSFSIAEERRFSNYPAADTSPFSDVEMASMRAENIARAQTIAAQSASHILVTHGTDTMVAPCWTKALPVRVAPCWVEPASFMAARNSPPTSSGQWATR